jgi:hypothetical protein
MTFDEEVRGKTKPQQFKILFAVGKHSTRILNYSEGLEWLINDTLGSDDLGNMLLTNNKDIPKAIGVYTALLTIVHCRVNIPVDPEEWDCEITISGIKQINKLQL